MVEHWGHIEPRDPHRTDKDNSQGLIGILELRLQVLLNHPLAMRGNVQPLLLDLLSWRYRLPIAGRASLEKHRDQISLLVSLAEQSHGCAFIIIA